MQDDLDHEFTGTHPRQPVDEMVCLVDRRQDGRDELQVQHAPFDRDVDEGRYGDLLIGAADDLAAAGPDRLAFVECRTGNFHFFIPCR